MATTQPIIVPGFDDPVHESNAVFRRVLGAMSHPGRIYHCPTRLEAPPPLGPAMAAVLLALSDRDAPVYLSNDARNPAVESFLRFHAGAQLVDDTANAAFVVVTDTEALPYLSTLPQGSDLAPELGCTLVIEVGELNAGSGYLLQGPGIQTSQKFEATGLPERFWVERLEMESRFPRGIDVIFTAGTVLAALPRTTKLEL